jgi:hypothetical protein
VNEAVALPDELVAVIVYEALADVEVVVPETTPVEELILNPVGKEGETVNVAAPPVFVTIKFVIAVPTVADIVDADGEITGALR